METNFFVIGNVYICKVTLCQARLREYGFIARNTYFNRFRRTRQCGIRNLFTPSFYAFNFRTKFGYVRRRTTRFPSGKNGIERSTRIRYRVRICYCRTREHVTVNAYFPSTVAIILHNNGSPVGIAFLKVNTPTFDKEVFRRLHREANFRIAANIQRRFIRRANAIRQIRRFKAIRRFYRRIQRCARNNHGVNHRTPRTYGLFFFRFHFNAKHFGDINRRAIARKVKPSSKYPFKRRAAYRIAIRILAHACNQSFNQNRPSTVVVISQSDGYPLFTPARVFRVCTPTLNANVAFIKPHIESYYAVTRNIYVCKRRSSGNACVFVSVFKSFGRLHCRRCRRPCNRLFHH